MSFPLPDPELLRIIALACGMSVTLLGAGHALLTKRDPRG